MCVIWGVPYLMIRVAVRELTPGTLVFGRTALGALLLLPIAARKGELRAAFSRPVPLIAFAVIEMGIPWLAVSSAETKLSSSLTGLLIAAVPLVGVVITTFTGDDDRINPRRLGGLLLGLGGVALIVGLDIGGTSLWPLLEIGAVAIGYALGPIILARSLSDLPTFGVIAGSVAICALGYLPVFAVQTPSSMPSGRVLLSVVGLAVICTAIAFVLFFQLIAEIGPVRATVITYINPAVAAILGITILGESFSLGMGIGFALVLAGSVLATQRRREPMLAEELSAA
jgi:drug/metabolite transporter (DMT)-like permease